VYFQQNAYLDFMHLADTLIQTECIRGVFYLFVRMEIQPVTLALSAELMVLGQLQWKWRANFRRL